MRHTIRSKKLGKTIEFSRPGTGYVYIDFGGKPGTLGSQICNGGELLGNTISYRGDDDDEFARICNRWWAAYLRKNRDYL